MALKFWRSPLGRAFRCNLLLRNGNKSIFAIIPNAARIHHSKFQLGFFSDKKLNHFTHISKLKNPTLSRIQPMKIKISLRRLLFFQNYKNLRQC